MAPVKGAAFLGAGEAPGPWRSWTAAAAVPAPPQPILRSRCHSLLPAHTARRLPRLPGSPTSPRARGVQPWLSVCSWDEDSEPAFSFNRSLRSVHAPSLQFLLFRGNWQDWTAQLLQRYTSPAEKILLFKDLSPVP